MIIDGIELVPGIKVEVFIDSNNWVSGVVIGIHPVCNQVAVTYDKCPGPRVGSNTDDYDSFNGTYRDELAMINSFKGENRWLSNFWPAKISFDGLEYDCLEKAYVAGGNIAGCVSDNYRLETDAS